jgi:hypothetical protein
MTALGTACNTERGTEGDRDSAAPRMAEVVAPGVISTSTRNETFPAEDPRTGDLCLAPEVAPFSGRWGDRAPRFTPDGGALYITSSRPRAPGDAAGDQNIWRVERTTGGWGEPVVPCGLGNCHTRPHTSPCLLTT